MKSRQFAGLVLKFSWNLNVEDILHTLKNLSECSVSRQFSGLLMIICLDV